MPATNEAPDAIVPDAYLVVTGEGIRRQVHQLKTVPATIGRSPDSDVVINDPRVSRSHARIDLAGARFVLEDLGSTNGTTLNGEAVSAPALLTDGDALSLAGVRAVFQQSWRTSSSSRGDLYGRSKCFSAMSIKASVRRSSTDRPVLVRPMSPGNWQSTSPATVAPSSLSSSIRRTRTKTSWKGIDREPGMDSPASSSPKDL